MFWVSRALARGRGRGVEEGWYVLAHIGDNFSLHVTNVHPEGGVHVNGMNLNEVNQANEVNGEDENEGLDACVKVEVDGTNPIGTRGFVVKPHFEKVLNGFAESATYRRDSTEGTLGVRRFRFEKAALQEAGSETGGVGSMQQGGGGSKGCIQLLIGLGQRLEKRLGREQTSGMLPSLEKTDEIAAVKKGESVRVNRMGEVMSEKLTRAKFELKCGCLKGIVKVFIRQWYWLESRFIIDRNGRAWKPAVPRPIDLTSDAEDAAAGAGERAAKRQKSGVIDLT